MLRVMLVVPISHFFSSGPPYAIKAFGVFEELTQCPDAIRVTGDVWVQANVHQSATFFAFKVELVKLLLQQFEYGAGAHASAVEKSKVIDFD